MAESEFTRADDLGITRDPPEPCWCGEADPHFSDDLPSRCGGSGSLDCRCGGDLCVCHWHGSIDCDGCPDCREYDEDDDYTDEDDYRERRAELDDERRANRGTSQCDQLCDPTCDWCLVGHDCPDQCGGGDECPYEALAREEARPKTLPTVEVDDG